MSLMVPPSSPILQELHRLDPSSPGFDDQLYGVLHGEEYQQCVANLKGDDLVWLIEHLDKVLGTIDPSNPAFQEYLCELRSISGATGILPTSYTITGDLLKVDPEPFSSRGYGDVYEGILSDLRICVKRIRLCEDNHKQIVKVCCQEAIIWKYMRHQNILPFLGVTISPLQLILDWMPGGSLLECLDEHPDADRLGLVSDIANGLHYLHSCNVIHGGIKGSSILIDDAGYAYIADFSHAAMVKDHDVNEPSIIPRWTAPEVLEGGANSKEADIFSFAMVVIEAFTSAVPFSGISAAAAIVSITQGKRPPRPTHPSFTENLWELIQHCWDQDPHLRPEAAVVSQAILNPGELPAWRQLISNTLPMDECVSLIKIIFSDPNEVEVVNNLSGNDAQAFIDIIDEALDSLPSQIYKRSLRCLYRICNSQVLLPKSLEIPLCYDPTEIPQYHGGFADVWKGEYNGQTVAAKALRISAASNIESIRKSFCREVVIWKTLCHPNILSLIGVTMGESRFVMVSEWMEYGNINMFLRENANVNRLELLRDATRGLMYMHDHDIVHGDLKGANILIKRDGHACLADFSLLKMISDDQTFISTCIEGGTTPWMSPELLAPESFGLEKCCITRESDRWALGMVVYEVLSGLVPFAPVRAPVYKIMCGEHPQRPQGEEGAWFTEVIWEMLELSWKQQPNERISLNMILQCLQDNMYL